MCFVLSKRTKHTVVIKVNFLALTRRLFTGGYGTDSLNKHLTLVQYISLDYFIHTFGPSVRLQLSPAATQLYKLQQRIDASEMEPTCSRINGAHIILKGSSQKTFLFTVSHMLQTQQPAKGKQRSIQVILHQVLFT